MVLPLSFPGGSLEPIGVPIIRDEGAALLLPLPLGARAQRLRCGRLKSALDLAHLLMSLYTYRWHFALASMDSIAGVTTGANVRDALSRATITPLPDGQMVGDALGVSPELLELAENCHVPEVAFKHGEVLISMVVVEPRDEESRRI